MPISIVVTIEIENAAFDPSPVPECARILRGLADAMERNDRAHDYTLRDINGNRCGRVTRESR